jgi:hypothetical protein
MPEEIRVQGEKATASRTRVAHNGWAHTGLCLPPTGNCHRRDPQDLMFTVLQTQNSGAALEGPFIGWLCAKL